ncbi:hypothetical protein MJD09_03800 [bacterium]|nr:hypothetical protein [bacterium]
MMSLLTSFSGSLQDFLQPQFLVNALVKVSLVLASAGLVNSLLKRSSAAVRHWIWSLAFYGLLLMPFLSQTVPGWNLARLPIMVNSEVYEEAVASSPSGRTSLPVESVLTSQQMDQKYPAATGESAESPSQPLNIANASATDTQQNAADSRLWNAPWFFWVFSVWLAGTALLLGRLVWELGGIWWLLRTGKPNHNRKWTDVLRHCQARLQLKRKIHLAFSDRITIPITFGLFRSVVLLPDSARQWSSQEREVVLVHELEHVRRWDYVSNLVAQVVCAFYWLNPWFGSQKSG